MWKIWGIYVKIIANLDQSISEASREKIKEKKDYKLAMITKNPLAYWQLIVRIHQNLDSGDSQLDGFVADCYFRKIKQEANELITLYYAWYVEAQANAASGANHVPYSESSQLRISLTV